MPVEPSVTHRPQGVFHSVGQHRHVLKVHAAAVIVKVEADKCEIGVVAPQSLKSIEYVVSTQVPNLRMTIVVPFEV